MPPEPSRRKHGRPPPTTTEADASQNHDNETGEPDVDEQDRPRKRGRPSSKPAPPVKKLPASINSHKSRGRPARQAAPEPAGQEEEARPPPQQRRGRRAAEPRGHDQQTEVVEENNEPTQQPRKRRRGPPADPVPDANENRPPQRGEDLDQADKEHNSTTRTGRKKRGQKSTEKSKDTEVHAETAGQEEGPQRGKPSKKPSRSRSKHNPPSPNAANDTEERQPATRRKRGRPSSEGAPTTTRAQQDNASAKAPKPGRRDANSARQSGGASEVPEEESRPAKRRRSSQSQRADESTVLPPSPAKPYVHVASRVRRIRQSTIQEKWTPLGGASLAVAADMLQLGQQPILQRLDSTQQRRGHASSALHLVAGRIMRKMRKGLPFPPASMAPSAARGEADAGRETELDFEKVLDARQALERRLDPSLHAVELLRREKERLERELERDYQALKALEVSARAQAREQRSLLKKAHVLAPEAKPASQRNPEPRLMLNHQHGDSAITSPFTDIEDTELQALALQLGGHAESISTNLQQVEGIVPQLSRSKAMLQDVLQRYLDASQYEQVVLG